jgi:flagellar hook-associated protein 3
MKTSFQTNSKSNEANVKRPMVNPVYKVLWTVIIMVLLAGCRSQIPYTPMEGAYYRHPDLGLETVGRVALVELENLTSYPSVGADLSEALFVALQKQQYFGLITIAQSDARWKSLQSPLDANYNAEQLMEMRRVLQCDVRTLVTQIIGGIYDESNRETMADSINEHLEQLVQLANTDHVDQYIFGGTTTATAPYSVTRNSSGQITAVDYQGSDQKRNVQISTNIDVDLFLVGDDTFSSDNRQDPEFILSNTGSTLGTGTSNVKGAVWLTVTEDSGTYYMSIDGGTTKTAIPSGGSTNLAVADADGNVLYVNAPDPDTPGALSTGSDLVSVPGTYNIFDTLISIRDILNNEQSLSESQVYAALEDATDWIDEVNRLVVKANSAVGAKISFLDDFTTHLEDLQTNAEDQAIRIEEADIAQLAIDLAELEVLYEMSLSVAAKLLSISLLDYV